jgi:hypothetical protein
VLFRSVLENYQGNNKENENSAYDYVCEWCHVLTDWHDTEIQHAPDCPRQAALAAWNEAKGEVKG